MAVCACAFLKSGFISGDFSPSWGDYDRAFNIARASSAEGILNPGQRNYANLESRARRKVLSSLVLIRDERYARGEVWVGKMQVSFCCSVKRESDGGEFAFVRYMECAAPLDEVHDAQKCVCLQSTVSAFGKKRDDVERKEGRALVTAGEWFGVIFFQSTVSTVHAALAIIAVHMFTTELSWSG